MPVVTAHGVAVHSHYGEEVERRLQSVMETAIRTCLTKGFTSPLVIKGHVDCARQTELIAITREHYEQQRGEVIGTYLKRTTELRRAHEEQLKQMAEAHREEMTALIEGT